MTMRLLLMAFVALMLMSYPAICKAQGYPSYYCGGNCLPNGVLQNSCTAAPPGGCPTWTGSCNGWYISHGSPTELGTYYPIKNPCYSEFGFNMWGQYGGSSSLLNEGEGIFTSFNFAAFTDYDIRIAFTVTVVNPLNSGTTNGYVNIYEASGLTAQTTLECGGTPQTDQPGATSRLLKSIPITSSSMTVDQVFTTSAVGTTYPYVWIYPTGVATRSSSGGYPYINLTITAVFICTSANCPTGTVTYNSGDIPSSVNQGTVYIGSSDGTGGSGTVTASATVANTVTAGNFIRVDPNFSFIPSGSGSLVLTIQPCSSLYNTVAGIPDAYDSANTANLALTDSVGDAAIQPSAGYATLSDPTANDSSNSKLRIYPTVSSGIFNISGSPAELANAEIVVVDQAGRVLYNQYNTSNTLIQIDLSKLGNGLYMVEVRQPGKVITQKVIVSK